MAEFFSKKEFNELSSLRGKNDFKIETTIPFPDRVAPFYKLPFDQLETLRQFIMDYLKKGFIKPYFIPFSFLILFIRKADNI